MALDIKNTTGALQQVPQDPSATMAQVQSSTLENRASSSKIPYINDHKDSLVAWQLLDDESIQRATKENKLILLHVGYRACHHCRLMDLESFSNPDVAAVLNKSFIPIIVDRETRPDIDNIYMNYVQAVSNAGGWPLNLFLTPELAPVFGGTYWPGPGGARPTGDDNEDEVLDFLSILKKVRDIWAEQEARCRKEASEVLGQLREFASEGVLGARGLLAPSSIASTGPVAPTPAQTIDFESKGGAVSSDLDLDQLEEAYTHIAGTFDPVQGGFGLAPKFLTPPKLAFLLSLDQLPSAVQDVVGYKECKDASNMAFVTLRKIRDGALRDHVGGSGFTRCSITSDWTIPNFEKLVVDNALLLSLYTAAWRLSGGAADSEFYDVVLELAEFLSSAPVALSEGGFASSEAADSYGKRGDKDMREGGYYLLTRKEFDDVVEPAGNYVSPIVAGHWDIREHGNVDEDLDPNDDYMNQNILRIVRTPEELSKQFNTPVSTVVEYIKTAKKDLKERRDKDRVRPLLDDKIVTGWNGLVIASLAEAGAALKESDASLSEKVIGVAKKAVDFIKGNLWDEARGVLYRIWKDGRDTEGFAEDYAYLIYGLIELFKSTLDESLLEFADKLQKTQISLFYDSAGAFYSTTTSSPHTILRLKDGMDTSLPSTNAVSVSNLFRLGELLGDEKYTATARASINAFEAEMLQHPWLFPGLLAGLVMARLGDQKKESGEEGLEIKYKATREKA